MRDSGDRRRAGAGLTAWRQWPALVRCRARGSGPGLRRTVNRWTRPRSAEVPSRTARRGHPTGHHPGLARASIGRCWPGPDALLFPGAGGEPIRRSNINKLTGWPYAAEAIGAKDLHFHDLRHAGNQFAAASGARLRDLVTRMGHDSERAAMIYQH